MQRAGNTEQIFFRDAATAEPLRIEQVKFVFADRDHRLAAIG